VASAVGPDFQYSSPSHQAEAATAGMWLFLATEVLFFGGLLLCWIYCRHWNQLGFDAGARETKLWVGTLNTGILVTSSFIYAAGVAFIRVGDKRRLIQSCCITLILGLAFLGLKFGFEWPSDFTNRLFPAAADFKIAGPEEGGARLFFIFYFISTALHGIHMLIGIALLLWIIWRTRHNEFSALYYTPVQVVGLYWSFVDIIWLILYPLIYLVGRR
jgi:cytochrome c oxidase subunit III